MNFIVTDIDTVVACVRDALVTGTAPAFPTSPVPAVITEAQLIATIAALEHAADHRAPEAFAQVSPRALVVALAVLKGVVK